MIKKLLKEENSKRPSNIQIFDLQIYSYPPTPYILLLGNDFVENNNYYIELYLTLMFISIGCTSQNGGVPYHLHNNCLEGSCTLYSDNQCQSPASVQNTVVCLL